jgi:hypothetical protein
MKNQPKKLTTTWTIREIIGAQSHNSTHSVNRHHSSRGFAILTDHRICLCAQSKHKAFLFVFTVDAYIQNAFHISFALTIIRLLHGSSYLNFLNVTCAFLSVPNYIYIAKHSLSTHLVNDAKTYAWINIGVVLGIPTCGILIRVA